MNFKLSLLAAASLMAASAPTFAAIADSSTGNGELALTLRYYTGLPNSGGDDISATFDLGVTMDQFLANQNTQAFSMDWNLGAANYGSALADFMSFVGSVGGLPGNIEFSVIALDNTDASVSGGARYLTTAAVNTYPALVNSALRGFQDMNIYITSNNTVRGNHNTEANGASTSTQAQASDAFPSYFGTVQGAQGDSWRGRTTADTTARISVLQNFWFLTTNGSSNSVQSLKTPFGFDLDGNGTISATGVLGNEFGKWEFGLDGNGAPTGFVQFSNPAPVPEPESYAMMIAGLGLVGFMVRRRLSRR